MNLQEVAIFWRIGMGACSLIAASAALVMIVRLASAKEAGQFQSAVRGRRAKLQIPIILYAIGLAISIAIVSDFSIQAIVFLGGLLCGGGTWLYWNWLDDDIDQIEHASGRGELLSEATQMDGSYSVTTKKYSSVEGMAAILHGRSRLQLKLFPLVLLAGLHFGLLTWSIASG